MLQIYNYILQDGWQTVFLWGTLLLFIWVPVIGIITWIIRRLAKTKNHSAFMTYTFIALWTLGWASLILLISSVSRDLSARNTPIEQTIPLSNPTVQKLEIRNDSKNDDFITGRNWNFRPFSNFDQDTLFVKNINIRIVKAENDSFSVRMLKVSNGASREQTIS